MWQGEPPILPDFVDSHPHGVAKRDTPVPITNAELDQLAAAEVRDVVRATHPPFSASAPGYRVPPTAPVAQLTEEERAATAAEANIDFSRDHPTLSAEEYAATIAVMEGGPRIPTNKIVREAFVSTLGPLTKRQQQELGD